MKYRISVGIMAYNEEANIERLLCSILSQDFVYGLLEEIIIVASGCTDRTVDIATQFSINDKRIKILNQQHREGKASAINFFLSKASGDIYILESGDTIPEKNSIDKLVAPFKDPRIGMTGAHPVPMNPKNTFIGFAVNLMWELHHKISLVEPKLGELVAFRNFVKEIPGDTAVDEASIEAIIRKAGYELHYVPDAFVRNKGPENIKDFIKQRRRIAAGHKYLSRQQKHRVSTADPGRILRIIMQEHTWKFKETVWTLGVIGLEFMGRILGLYDLYIKKKNPVIWEIAASTKKLD